MVSIIVCVYKEKAEWVSRCIKSLLAQSYRDVEIVVVVDNPDISPDVLKCLEDLKALDGRIVLYFNDLNIGVAKSRNVGVSLSSGDYIAFLDADDYCHCHRIEHELNYLQNKALDLVCSRYIAVDENEKVLFESAFTSKDINKIIPLYNPVANPTVLLKRHAFMELNGFREFVVCEDYDLWLRFVSSGFKCGMLNELLTFYTIRNNSLSRQNTFKTYCIDKMVKRYFKQRIKNGLDDYSPEKVNLCFSSIKNLAKKEKRFQRADLFFNKAKKAKGLFLWYVLRSFFYSPSFVMSKLLLKTKLLFIR